jgi:hypothetical protein
MRRPAAPKKAANRLFVIGVPSLSGFDSSQLGMRTVYPAGHFVGWIFQKECDR